MLSTRLRLVMASRVETAVVELCAVPQMTVKWSSNALDFFGMETKAHEFTNGRAFDLMAM